MTKWAVALAVAVSAVAALRAAEAPPPRFVVHEWGVMVTGRADGAAADPASTQLGPPEPLVGGLPEFVQRHDKAYKPRRQDHGWDKPVLHFYGPLDLPVTVVVGTPMGRPLAYWPPPDKFVERMGKPITSRKEMMVYSLSEATGMRWFGTLSAEPLQPPPDVAKDHWWSAAREVPGAWFNTKSASERFLFYEATAHQPPALNAQVSERTLTLLNTGDAGSGPVVVLVNDGTKRFGRWIDDVPAHDSARLTKQDVLSDAWTDEQTLAQCAKQWRAAGMTEQETGAILRAWRSDLLNTVGFLVIGRMPAATYEKMFPLKIDPKPDELVRAGFVLDVLPGQDARAGWLPGVRRTMDGWAQDLTAGDFRTRDAAAARFQRSGDLARPYLKELATGQGGHPEAARAAAVLLRQMEPPAVAQP